MIQACYDIKTQMTLQAWTRASKNRARHPLARSRRVFLFLRRYRTGKTGPMSVRYRSCIEPYGGWLLATPHPGPDGNPGRVLVITLAVLGHILSSPSSEKKRGYCLQKVRKSCRFPSTFQPICLQNDSLKIFETVIFNRISGHLSRGDPDLSVYQFRIRPGRSTVNAIRCVRSPSGSAVLSALISFTFSALSTGALLGWP